MTTPRPIADLVATLDEGGREYFEERAGILEYEAGYSRSRAERLAWEETVKYMMKYHSDK